jgi:hypothetical protein
LCSVVELSTKPAEAVEVPAEEIEKGAQGEKASSLFGAPSALSVGNRSMR